VIARMALEGLQENEDASKRKTKMVKLEHRQKNLRGPVLAS
jgi:hypothetical protein